MNGKRAFSRRDAENFLKRYRSLIVREQSLKKAIDEAYERAIDISVHLKPISVVGGSGPYDPIAEYVATMTDTQQPLKETALKTHDALVEILDAIDSIQNEMQKTILTLRYIEGQSWNAIQRRINYEHRNTMYLHCRALSNISRWMSENDVIF